MQLIYYIMDRVSTMFSEEDGQDGFEYLLIVGGVSVAIVLAMAAVPGLMPTVIKGVCTQIKGVVPSITC